MAKTWGRDSERTRSAVLQAAEQLFAENGFAGTSMRGVAEASGISQPLIHHHFGTKRDLYLAVKQQVIDRFKAMLPAGETSAGAGAVGPETTGRAMLAAHLRTLFQFFRDNPRLLRLLSWARLEGDSKDLWPGERELIEAFRDLGRRSQDRREMRGEVDPLMLVAIMESLVTSWWENREWMARLFPHKDAEELDRLFLDNATMILLHGVAV